ncbi:MAG: hypothetical protein ACYDD4_09925 [Acidimicrobiales bacterium]
MRRDICAPLLCGAGVAGTDRRRADAAVALCGMTFARDLALNLADFEQPYQRS